jgi:hypothetical protein
MTTSEQPTFCTAYDQISDRTCRYYANHGGRHNFARLDHDCALERELRRQLDEMQDLLVEALDLFDAARGKVVLTPAQCARAIGLRKCAVP